MNNKEKESLQEIYELITCTISKIREAQGWLDDSKRRLIDAEEKIEKVLKK